MSYQLPDLLGLLLSLSTGSEDDDGDLHINSLYHPASNLAWSRQLSMTSPSDYSRKTHFLQKHTSEFLEEYNPALLASTFIPFRSLPDSDKLAQSVLQIAVEWLAVSALVAEEVLRPGKIVDLSTVGVLPVEMNGDGRVWVQREAQLLEISNKDEGVYQVMKNELLDALLDLPSPPDPVPLDHSPRMSPPPPSVQNYVRWRTNISGLGPLYFQCFSPPSPSERNRFNRALNLVLEIIACVTDLFAYNIHQAWYTRQDNKDRQHLNLVSFLMAADLEMTLQGAINCAGEMIRQRVIELNTELALLSSNAAATSPLNSSAAAAAVGTLKSSLSSFVSMLPSLGSFTDDQKTVTPASSGGPGTSVTTDVTLPGLERVRDKEREDEIKKVLVNWLRGAVHWAYEVEYFYPINAEGSGNGKKRGSEVRDYGWVFLIKET
ncbi:hypothetical protein NP233_g505 [Leucocoprinus birnbaumii]|uniref:Uncharacterized protein n=1 Tax=Leucocoprinus birnbaumii TaxID=56174 RepID=A0AAD5W1Q5_9AGAR|nr:hypothetical protein NP233_g505 [Leucocoprinus birnbaumii]